MKNIHKIRENIYITSDEEIKKGDWVLFMFGEVTEIVKVTTIVNNAFETKQGFGYGLEYCKKIILTTDQNLIKDGVQTIDDKFLEWFVKNPSCEEVEINSFKTIYHTWLYKIIIPKEEPKQETLEEICPICETNRLIDGVCKECTELLCKPISVIEKQETLEGVAEMFAKTQVVRGKNLPEWDDKVEEIIARNFIEGAKWQQKNSYSEEEVKQIIKLSCEEGMLIQRTINDKVKIPYSRIKDFTIKMFEQFKKKQ